MNKLLTLKAGDSVEIIAPASRFADQHLFNIKTLLESWGLTPIIPDNIFGNDLLCANSDEMRFQLLKNALFNPNTKAVICGRGGYGSMRLIPTLAKLSPPSSPKIFVGMSDITALMLFLQQQWAWPTVHGAPAIDKFSPESIAQLKSLLFAETTQIEYKDLIPLNVAATKSRIIHSTITGGNLCLVQTSIGTLWQLDGNNKILFLEEVNERGYRVDRMLEHLRQANILHGVTALLLGDFIDGKEADGSSLIQPVLKRFAESCEFPVVQIQGIGHAYTSLPLPLGTPVELHCGDKIKLICAR